MLKQAFPSWLFFLYTILVVGTKTPLSAMVAHCECRINLDHIFSSTGMWYLPHTQEDYNSLTYFCTKNKPVPFFFLYKWTGSVWVPWWFSGENCPLEERKFAVWIQQLPFLCGACVLSKVLHARSFLKWIYDSWDRLHANVTLNWINH